MQHVWAGGVISLQPGNLRFYQWTPNFSPNNFKNTAAQLWVRFWDLGLEYWDPTTLFEIASRIGTPIKIDPATLNKSIDVEFSNNPAFEILVERAHGDSLLNCRVKQGENSPSQGCGRSQSRRGHKRERVVSKYVPKDAGKNVVIEPTPLNLPDDREGPSFVKQTASDIPTVPSATRLESDQSISMLKSVDPISFPTMVAVPVQSDLNNSASVVDVDNMTPVANPLADEVDVVAAHIRSLSFIIVFFKSGCGCSVPISFSKSLVRASDFMAFVATVWHDSNFLGCPMFVLSAKLGNLNQNLKTWNRSHFGNIHVKVDSAMSDLDLIPNEIDTLGPTEDRLSKEEELCLKAHDALRIQGYFSCSTGVRQGDPLSHLLFFLAEEVFSTCLSLLVTEGKLLPMSGPKGVSPPSHVLFTDDIMEGGLGLRDFTVMNRSLLLKRCWDVVSSDSPTSIFLRSRFLKSSEWLGLKKIFPDLPQLQWLIGDGSQVRFWMDNCLGEPIAHSLGIPHHVASALKAKVCDFIGPNGWVLPTNFSSSLPVIAETITSTPISLEVGVYKLIWTSSSSGLMTAKDAFSYLNGHNSQLVWHKAIWDSSIQPRKSITTWKALHGRLLTDDHLQCHGVPLVYVCCFCLNVAETVSHIFGVPIYSRNLELVVTPL
ncbi:ribonuclease H protein [Pyrus ussuriensis x Pyrus communis]|uniref:Ribonuclease H protein n=1 Tax=Pyrus ussuriensis x Pyrus communis TaxID=2448454 RepID=A0A5N5F3G5_9ROSA|nr:ribonuclease H protein [Pyrus ussuriensis x Pyrus communis]